MRKIPASSSNEQARLSSVGLGDFESFMAPSFHESSMGSQGRAVVPRYEGFAAVPALSSPVLPEDVTAVLQPFASFAKVRAGERRPEKERGRRAARYGGKSVMLADLAAEGVPVPPGWVLDARAFERAVDQRLPRGHDVVSLLKLAGTQAGT